MNTITYSKAEKHLVAVDCIIFGYDEGDLQVLLFPRAIMPEQGCWSLMGGFVNLDESLESAAKRVLFNITGFHDIRLDQVGAFSEPNRDSGERVISIAFSALIRPNQHDKELIREHGAQWWPINKLPKLIFDHEKMVEKALLHLQALADSELVGRDLLPERFTLMQVRQLHEAIFRKPLDPGNFRKKALSMGVLNKLTIKNTSESKKGAFYYEFSQP